MVGCKTAGLRWFGGPLATALFLVLIPLLAGSATASASGEGGLSPVAPPPEPPPVAEGDPGAAPGMPAPQSFPVRGRYSFWDGMGAGRGHQGVDIGARCGTPLVAAQAGRVRYVKYHGRAGHYVVIDVAGSSQDHVYMHLRRRALVRPGQYVHAGRVLGQVGATGNARGCHLHFEVWEGPWYGGGAPVDPMPYLSLWEGKRNRRAAR